MGRLKSVARATLEGVESFIDTAVSPRWNPLYQLGALGWFFFWIVVVSGIYLYIFFDTGVTQAYESVEQLTHAQWFAGGVMRSFHRYASDALLVVMMLHLLREFVLDRLHGVRWFGWFTGVPLIWLVFACGITGYWVVWDKLAQYVALGTTEWLDTLPLFGEPIARNFLHDTTLSGRFFTLLVFIHIAVPLVLLFLMWLHIQRLSRPRVNPPRGLAIGMLTTLLALSLAHPALSQGPADLSTVPGRLGLDWFYLGYLPLQDRFGGGPLWVGTLLGTLLLLAAPWLPPGRKPAVAEVDLGNCNGCGRCVADCPYSAVELGPRSDGAPFSQQAVVRADNCVGCGLCVGACPTATPFRRTTELVPGIDLPATPVSALREQLLEATARLAGESRMVLFRCEHGVANDSLSSGNVAVLTLPCVGMLPPAFIDLAITRRHADGVFLTGCRAGDCHERHGIAWTEQRIQGVRDPYLRARVPRNRIDWYWAGIDRHDALHRRIEAFATRLRELGPYRASGPSASATPAVERRG